MLRQFSAAQSIVRNNMGRLYFQMGIRNSRPVYTPIHYSVSLQPS